MSDQSNLRREAPAPRVIEVERADAVAPLRIEPAAQVIVTERTEPVVPTEPTNLPVAVSPPVHRRDPLVTLALTGLAVFFAGWLAVDAVGWIAGAFERSTALGWLAATVVAAGIAGAGAVVGREVTSLFRLKSVEAIHRRFADNLDRLPQPMLGRRLQTPFPLCRASARSNPRSKRFSGRCSCITPPASRSTCCRAR